MTLPLVNVHVFVNGQRQTIKMERGCTFTNNGGTYGLSEDGTLMFKAKGSNDWVNTDQIKMTNYQWRIFQNMSNNDNDVNSYTRADIEKAQALYRQGNFRSDMSMDLPSGYSLDKPELSTAEQYVQVDVMHANSKQATLRFQIEEIAALKAASQAQQPNNLQNLHQNEFIRAREVSPEIINLLKDSGNIDENGNFFANEENVPFLYEYKWHDGFGPLSNNPELLSDLNGKKVTPDLIDDVVNRFIDNEVLGRGSLGDLVILSDYLKPETVNKLINYSGGSEELATSWGEMRVAHANVDDVKNFYDRLTPEQQIQYYKGTLSVGSANATHYVTGGDYSTDGNVLAKYIFLDKFDGENYETLVNFVSDMNSEDGRWGLYEAKNACKNLISTLLTQGKITPAQANELNAIVK